MDEVLSTIVGNLYDAVIEPARWETALGQARDYVGGSAAAIYSRDSFGRPFAIHHEDGRVDPHYTRLYVEHYVKIDPTATAQTRATVDHPLTATDMIDYDELLKSVAYQEWIKPQGWVDFINIGIERTPRSAVMFGIFRHHRDGMIDNDARRRMKAIGPHIKRSALIETSFAARAGDNAAFTDLLDGIGSALFLMRSDGQIAHANTSGRDMIAAARIAYAPGGRLALRDPVAHRVLATAIAASASGDRAMGRESAAIPVTTGEGERHIAHVLPLTSGARRRAGRLHGAVAAVFIRRIAVDLSRSQETVARHFRLTPSELRVLLVIIDSGGVQDAAETLGVSVPTVKTHLRSIYGKTGTGRHADLVKLVAGYASPLVA